MHIFVIFKCFWNYRIVVHTCTIITFEWMSESFNNTVVLPLSEYSDISVVCGTSAIELAIQICPVIYTGYNTSLLILNHIWNNAACQGTLDTSVTPPVARFSFPIREGNACGSNFLVSIASVKCPDLYCFFYWTFIQPGNIPLSLKISISRMPSQADSIRLSQNISEK